MKLVKMLVDSGYWTKGIHVMDNRRASMFCKKIIDWNYYDKTGKIKKRPYMGYILKDLGLHFGRSKHIYEKDGMSRVPLYEGRGY